MKKTLLLFFFFSCYASVFSQNFPTGGNVPKDKLEKPPVDLYKIISIDRDTTYLDTTLTVQKEYKFNYLKIKKKKRYREQSKMSWTLLGWSAPRPRSPKTDVTKQICLLWLSFQD